MGVNLTLRQLDKRVWVGRDGGGELMGNCDQVMKKIVGFQVSKIYMVYLHLDFKNVQNNNILKQESRWTKNSKNTKVWISLR